MEKTLRTLTKDELAGIQNDLDIAGSICKKYIREFDGTFTSRLLDQVFALWLFDKSSFVQNYANFTTQSDRKPTYTMIKYALGSAFGNLLNAMFKSEWVITTGRYGSEIGIHHYNPCYTAFPYSSIQQGINTKKVYFFVMMESAMRLTVER